MLRNNNTLRKFIKEILTEQNSDTIWYHGSNQKFTSFSDSKQANSSALGIFVTADKNLAEIFGDYVYVVEILYNNPYTITMDKWDEIRGSHAKDTVYFQEMKRKLLSKGHDSIFIQGRELSTSSGHVFADMDMVVLFDKSQVTIKELLT